MNEKADQGSPPELVAEPSVETSTEPTAAPEPPTNPWRRRLARALLVGGVLYAAFQLAPVLPHAQTLSFRAPAGERITELEIALRDAAGTPQNAVKLHLREPQREVKHDVELPNGAYVLELDAVLKRAAAPEKPEAYRRVELERQVRLEEHTVRIELTP